MRTTRLEVRLTPEERERLRELAADRELNESTIVRQLIRQAHVFRFGADAKPNGGDQ